MLLSQSTLVKLHSRTHPKLTWSVPKNRMLQHDPHTRDIVHLVHQIIDTAQTYQLFSSYVSTYECTSHQIICSLMYVRIVCMYMYSVWKLIWSNTASGSLFSVFLLQHSNGHKNLEWESLWKPTVVSTQYCCPILLVLTGLLGCATSASPQKDSYCKNTHTHTHTIHAHTPPQTVVATLFNARQSSTISIHFVNVCMCHDRLTLAVA